MGRLVVRAADPGAERGAILGVLERNLPRAVKPGRYDWLYLSNPAGPALVWVAADASSGAVVGTSAAHRRRMRVGGGTVDALNLGDFAIDRDHRALGPALQLLKATLEPVRAGAFALSYDHGNDAMQALYRRIEGAHFGRMVRLVRPVRASGYARRRLGRAGVVVGAAGDLALRVRDRLLRPERGIRVADHEGPFPESFTALDDARAREWPVAGVRDAAYLTWRYARHPIWRHATLVASRGAEMVGYAIHRPDEQGNLEIVEYAGPDALLAALLARARQGGAESVVAQAMEGSASERFFRSRGFRPRGEGSGAVRYALPGSPAAALVGDPANWWMVEGDRDV
jgi:hypothetical protein